MNDLERQIIEMYQNGHKYASIIKELRCTAKTIASTCRKYNIPLRSTIKHGRNNKEIEMLIQEYQSGKAMPFIEKKYNISHHTLRSIYIENGIKIKGRGTHGREITQEFIEKIINDHKNGMSLIKLSRKYHIGLEKMIRELENADIKDYNYRDYVRKRKKNENDINDLKIDNRFAFYQTFSNLGYAFEDIASMIEKIEAKYAQ